MRLTFILLCLFATSSLLAQIPKDAISVEDAAFSEYYLNPDNIPKVTGKILNIPENEYKKINITYTLVTPSRERQDKKTTGVMADGSFELELDHGIPYQLIFFKLGSNRGSLYAKDGVHLEIDYEKLGTGGLDVFGEALKFKGKDSELAILMQKYSVFELVKRRKLYSYLQKLNSNQELDYSDYKRKYDSIHNIIEETDDRFIAKNPSDYGWIIKNDHLSAYYKNLLFKHWFHGYLDDSLWEDIKNHKPYVVSNSGMMFYKNLETYLNNKSGLLNLFNEFDDFTELKGLNEEQLTAIEKYEIIKENLNNQKPYDTIEAIAVSKIINPLFTALAKQRVQEGPFVRLVKILDAQFATAKADMLKLKMYSNDPQEQKTIDEIVLASTTTPWCREEIITRAKVNQAKLDKIETTLEKTTVISNPKDFGSPLAEFDFGAKLYEVNDMTAQELLAKIKSSFKDNALMLDFWAVWCGPCLGDFPYSKKLHDAVEDEPVEFVYLCTSSGGTLDKWKSKIAQFKLAGTHLFVEESIEAELMKLFNGTGFPTYAFINKNGEYKPGSISRMQTTDKEQFVKLIHGE